MTQRNGHNHVRVMVAAIISSAVCSGLASAADAQGDALEEVQVTGTRIQQRGDYVSPNPVQTFDAEDLQKLGIVNVSDAITQIPANVSSFQAANQGGNPFFVGSTLANLRGLNPYFGTRTLTLVDSRRFVPTNQGESVDLNFIPSILVNRMEVVTGGASAAYGSDAVSGVVNILLDKKLDGVKVDADYGVTQRGDGKNYHAGLAFGTDLMNGRSHFIFGAEYQKSESIDDCAAARKWCGESDGLLTNGGSFFDLPGGPFSSPLDTSKPNRFRASNLRVNQVNANGVIFRGVPGSTTAISANDAGTGVGSFAIGQYGTVGPDQTVLGGDGVTTTAITSLYPDIERKTAYGHLTFDFTDSLSGFVEASFGQVNAFVTQGGPGFVVTSRCVNPDYAYLSGAFGAAVLAAAGNDNRPFGGCAPNQTLVRKDWYSQINRDVTTDTKVYRGVVGLSGAFGDSTWHWDGYYQFGHTTREQVLSDNNTAKRMDMALDAVIDNRPGSATNGQIVCRVTRDGVVGAPIFPGGPLGPPDPARIALAPGCVPLNMFGSGAISQAAHDYSFGELFEANDIKQHVVAFSTSGELWQGWGHGPLSAAAGVEYRLEKLTNEAADVPFFQRTDFAAQYGDPFAGTTKVKEGFVELEMPLAANMPLIKILQLNGAMRRTKYENEDDLVASNAPTSVSVTTWKLAAVWDPVDWLRVRGSRSRDLRAAGFRELYYSQSIPADPPGTSFGFGGVNNPWLPAGPFGAPFDPAVVILSGNTALRPEKATTSTIGFVLTPGGWAEGMHFSADFYRVKLVDGISGGLIQKTISNCYNGDLFYCNQIQGTPGAPGPNGTPGFSDVTQLRAPYENGRPYKSEGIDLAWDHLLPLGQIFSGVSGNLALRLSATHAIKTELQYLQYPNYEARNVVGQVGAAGFLADYAPTPKWIANFVVSYLNGPLALTLQSQYTGSGKLNNETPWTGPDEATYNPTLVGSVDDNTVAGYFNFNLNASYNFDFANLETAQVFVSVNNLFDRDPPFSNGGIGGVNGIFYDTLGRTYRLGIRTKF